MGYDFQKRIVLSTRIKYFRKKVLLFCDFIIVLKLSLNFGQFSWFWYNLVSKILPFHRYGFILNENVQMWFSFFDNYGKLCWKKLFSLGPFEKQSHHTNVITLFMIGPWEKRIMKLYIIQTHWTEKAKCAPYHYH